MRHRCLVGSDSRSTYGGGARCDEQFRDGRGEEEQGAGEDDMEKEGCSEAFLRRLTGQESLGLVHKLLLTAVDTSVTQVDNLGVLVPHLTELRFGRGSTLASFRDLGSSLVNLRVLWLSACGVCHLDGVGALVGLEELYLAFNDVEDLTSIALHDRLEVLDLESNSISDVEQAMQLGTCPRLWSLTLTANPVCRDRWYRRRVVEAVPQLAMLDDENVTDRDRTPSPRPMQGKRAVVTPPEANSTISLGAGEEGNRNLRETERLPPGSRAAVTDTTCSAHDAQMKSGKTGGGLLPEPFPSCRQMPSEDLVKSAGLDIFGMVSPSYSWLTGSRFRTTGACCADSGEGASSGGCTSKRENNREEGRGGAGQDTAGGGFVSTTTRATRLTAAEGRKGEGGGGGGGGGGVAGIHEERHEEHGSVNSWDNPAAAAAAAVAAAALFVDEEELVGKAVKALRTAPKLTSPRWPPDDGRTCNNGVDKDGHDCIEQASSEERQQSLDATDRDLVATAVGSVFSSHVKGGEGSGTGSGEGAVDDYCDQKGSDWLMKFLSFEDIGPAAGEDAPKEGRSQASSSLTHGSELSIAGNPALGLRRRRTPGKPSDDRTTAPSASLGATKHPHAANTDTVTRKERPRSATADDASRRGSSAGAHDAGFCPEPASTGSTVVGVGGGVWAKGRDTGGSKRGGGGEEKVTRGRDFDPIEPAIAGTAEAAHLADRRALVVTKVEGARPRSDDVHDSHASRKQQTEDATAVICRASLRLSTTPRLECADHPRESLAGNDMPPPTASYSPTSEVGVPGGTRSTSEARPALSSLVHTPDFPAPAAPHGCGESRLGWLETHKPRETAARGEGEGMALGWVETGKSREKTSRREGEEDRSIGWLDTAHHRNTAREREYSRILGSRSLGWLGTGRRREMATTTRGDEGGGNGDHCPCGSFASRDHPTREICPGRAELPSVVTRMAAVEVKGKYTTPPAGSSADQGEDDEDEDDDHDDARALNELGSSRPSSDDALMRSVGGLSLSQHIVDDDDDRDWRRRRRRRQKEENRDSSSHHDRSSCCSRGGDPIHLTSANRHSSFDVPEWSPAPTTSSDGGGFDDDGVADTGIVAVESNIVGGSVPIGHDCSDNLGIDLKAGTVRTGGSIPTTITTTRRRDCEKLGTGLRATSEVDFNNARGFAVSGSAAADGTQATVPWLDDDQPSGRGHVHHNHHSRHHRHHSHQHHHRHQERERSPGRSEKTTTASTKHRRKSDSEGVLGGDIVERRRRRRGAIAGKGTALGDDNRLTPLLRERRKKVPPFLGLVT